MLLIAAAAGNVLFYGCVGWFLASRIGSREQAHLAGLFLAAGFAIGSFGGHASSEVENFLALRGGGYLLGLLILSGLLIYTRIRRQRQMEKGRTQAVATMSKFCRNPQDK